jgi:hypothetical protein
LHCFLGPCNGKANLWVTCGCCVRLGCINCYAWSDARSRHGLLYYRRRCLHNISHHICQRLLISLPGLLYRSGCRLNCCLLLGASSAFATPSAA